MKNIKFKKIFSILFISTFTIGMIFSTINSYKSSLKNYDKTQFVSGKEKKSFKDSLYDSRFASDDTVDPTDITIKRLNDYIKISKTKLTYKLLFAGASCSKDNPQVQNIVGTYLHNVTPTNDLDSKGLQEQYQKVKEENKKVGIDVVDFDEFKNYDAISLVDSYLNTFKLDGHTDSEVESLKTILLSYLSEATNNARENLDNQLDLSFEIANTQGFDQMSPEIDHRTAVINSKLASALRYEQSLFDEGKFQITSSAAEFLRYYSDYTTDGSTTPNPEIKALSVGDVVPENLLQYLLTYNYDTVYGADYAEAEYYGFDITPDEISANTNSEYDPIALGLCSYTQPLSSLKCDSCVYGLGEFIPGYALKLAIKSINDTTDSHKCEICFTKGVGYIDSDNQEHIIWDTKDGTLESAKDDTQGDVTINVEIGNEYLDLIKNISSNVYFSDSSKNTVDFSAITDISLSKNGGYFNSTKNTRKKLDEILANYTEDTYDHFDTKPFYITGSDIQNVLPSETKFPVSSFDDFLHTNQQFALIPTLVDSNTYTMDLMCGYIDKMDYIDNNGNKQQKIFVANYNTFLINSQNYNKITVQFDISNDLKTKINYAKTIYSLMSLVHGQRSFFKNAKTKDDASDDVDKISNTLSLQIGWHIAYLSSSVIFLGINELLSIYYVSLAALQYVTVFTVAGAIITTVYLLLAIAGLAANTLALCSVCESETEVISEKLSYQNKLTSFHGSLSSSGNTISTISNKMNDKIYDTFSEIKQNYNPLFDPYASFGNKKKAAEIIIDFTNNEDFLNTLIDVMHKMDIRTYDLQQIEDVLKPIDFSKVTDDSDNIILLSKKTFSFKINTLDDEQVNKIYKSTLIIIEEASCYLINSLPAITSIVEKMSSYVSRYINLAYADFVRLFSDIDYDFISTNLETFFNRTMTPLAQNPVENRPLAYIFHEKDYIQNHFESFKYFDNYELFYCDSNHIWDKIVTNVDCEELLQQCELAFNDIGKSNWWPEFKANLLNVCKRNSIKIKEVFYHSVLPKIDVTTGKMVCECILTDPIRFYLFDFNKNFLNLYQAIVKRTAYIAERNFVKLLSDQSKDASYFNIKYCKNFNKFRRDFINDVKRVNLLKKSFKNYLIDTRVKEVQYSRETMRINDFENRVNKFYKKLDNAEIARSGIKSLSKFNISLCPAMQVMLLAIPTLLDLINTALEVFDIV